MANILNQIAKSVSNEIARDRKIEDVIYEKMKTYELPYLVYKTFRGRANITPMISTIVRYWKAGTINSPGYKQKAGMLYGSELIHFDSGRLRIATKELQEQIIQINDQLNELHRKKQELLDTYWSKCKKLTWQKAEEYDEIRKQYWSK